MKKNTRHMMTNGLTNMATSSFSLRIVLSLLFIFYALSPVFYVYATENSINEGGRGMTRLLLPGPDVKSGEVIFTRPVFQKDAFQENSAVKIVLRKKRAVMPRNVLQDTIFINDFLPKNVHLRSDCPPAWCLAEDKVKKALEGKRFLHSGLSPPFI